MEAVKVHETCGGTQAKGPARAQSCEEWGTAFSALGWLARQRR